MSDPKRPKTDEPKRGRELVLERDPRTQKPRMYRVILHNDDYTTMEFVTWVLQVVFQMSDQQATHLMLAIHHQGHGVAGVYTRDIAETKAAQVVSLAEEHGMPLQCTTEPDD
ncbi:MAG: ATP-dependent Clp protease adapter ClpS [Myxococcales bacterium]|nr:ATP-dependent Clp protease adapter ClpS [Myxococcales bacterium]MCB9736343.1 ATP-dependent Clp protease adapter ClpS [Deltaproteobacteria bacterium]